MRRETWIKRLALFLCAVLFVPSLLWAIPATQAEAATKYSGGLSYQYCRDAKGNYSTRNIKLQVEAGQEFNIGDWVSCHIQKGNNWQEAKLSELKGVKYKSTNKKAVILNNRGVAKTKKTGTTTITMKKGNINVKLQIQVVRKGSLTKLVKNSKNYQNNMNAAIKTAGSKITAKNYENFFEKLEETEKLNCKIKKLYCGTLKKGYENTNKVIVPQYATYDKYRNQLAAYISQQPSISFDSRNDKQEDLLSASAFTMMSQSNGVLQLKEAVSLADILKLQSFSVAGYYFKNDADDHFYYDQVKKALDSPFTISNSLFQLISVQDGDVYSFDIAVSYQSDKAVVTIADKAELPSGTYKLNDYAKKYIGDFTITVP